MSVYTDDAAYWRGLVAAAAEVKSAVVTQFSPDGFAAWLGTHQWFYVALGELALNHDGAWTFIERSESLERRQQYAHRTRLEALAALRAAVAPDEPLVADLIITLAGAAGEKGG